jgi:hypothetical protein
MTTMKRLDLTLRDRPKRAEHTAYEMVDGQAVIINLQDSTYIALNETGSFLWARLDGETTLEAIAQALAETYQVDLAVTRPDVLELAQELLARGMIELASRG